MLHYMSGNDYRRGRRQVSFVVDEGLWLAVKAAAAGGGVSVTAFVTDLLENAVGTAPTVGEQQGTPLFELDWDALMERGRESRASTGRASGYYGEAVASVALDRSGDGQTISLYGVDPIEEIA